MLTTTQAAQLLASTRSVRDLAAITHALGFASPLPLDRRTAQRLGIPQTSLPAALATGAGTLRALLLEVDGIRDTPQSAQQLARVVARRAPEFSWLVVARDRTAGRIVLAAPTAGSGAIAALEVDPAHVRESDAESLAAMVGAREGSDVMVHLRWRETLGRDALTRRFYRELHARVDHLAETALGPAPRDARQTIALLHTSRLLFLAFLEVRGWLDGDREFLRRHFSARAGGHGAHARFLKPLWFGTLNTPMRRRAASARGFGRVPFLNGGLFTRTPLERRWHELRFTDDAIGALIDGLLGRYRLTARETTTDWSDAAVDPEMLGRAFESLMHQTTRRTQGAFYTPPAMVTRVVRDGFAAALESRGIPIALLDEVSSGDPVPAQDRARLLTALGDQRILDPACGSGAFLVFALEAMANLRGAAGDLRDAATRRRVVVARNIFGVDLNPTAVWLCQLRLWLSVVVEEPHDDPLRLTPLPNLDRNIREGDALAGAAFADASPESDPRLATQRLRYIRATGARKRTLGRALDRSERSRAIAMLEHRVSQVGHARRELLLAARSPDLFTTVRGTDRASRHALAALRSEARRLRGAIGALRLGGALPFSFATHFPEIAAAGGFSLVIGNPPWVRTHGIPHEQREQLRARFSVFRAAAWASGAQAAAAGRGFASQADLAALFVERSVQLCDPRGVIALLVPAKLWGALAGGGVRVLLQSQAPPLLLEDWSAASVGFDAVVYPSTVVARRGTERAPVIRIGVHGRDGLATWPIARGDLPLDDSPGAPWLLLPPEVRVAHDRLTRAGIPLAESVFGRPVLGVKSGCNEAFVLARGEAMAEGIPASHLRPLLRGEHLLPWRVADDARDSTIIWTHDARDMPCERLPASVTRRLQPWQQRLEQRSDGRGRRWWGLFRTEGARCDRPRVVWGDIGREPRAVVLPAGDPTVPLNTCYVVRALAEDDAFAFATLLNSPIAAAWLGVVAEPARGGYRRFLGWTCARIPIPRHWPAVRTHLAAIGRRAHGGDIPEASVLNDAVLDAYGVSHEDVAPLLQWQTS